MESCILETLNAAREPQEISRGCEPFSISSLLGRVLGLSTSFSRFYRPINYHCLVVSVVMEGSQLMEGPSSILPYFVIARAYCFTPLSQFTSVQFVRTSTLGSE